MRKLSQQKLEEILVKRMEADLADGRVGGTQLYVSQEGRPLFRRSFGVADQETKAPMTDKTMYRLASMTKPVTSIAIGQLWDRGLVDLEDPITRFLPEFADMEYYAEAPSEGKPFVTKKATRPLTVRMMLNHTSGIQSLYHLPMTKEEDRTLENAIAYYARMPLDFDPGSMTAYSSCGAFDVLARIIEVVSGQSYPEYLKKNLFDPCEMADATFSPTDEQWARMITMHNRVDGRSVNGATTPGCVFVSTPPTHPLGGAGLASTMEDYIHFAEMLVGEGTYRGRRIVSSAYVNLCGTLQIDPSLMTGTKMWGLATIVRLAGGWTGAFGWSGAFGTHFFVSPADKVTAVYMKNSLFDGGSESDTGHHFEDDVLASFED